MSNLHRQFRLRFSTPEKERRLLRQRGAPPEGREIDRYELMLLSLINERRSRTDRIASLDDHIVTAVKRKPGFLEAVRDVWGVGRGDEERDRDFLQKILRPVVAVRPDAVAFCPESFKRKDPVDYREWVIELAAMDESGGVFRHVQSKSECKNHWERNHVDFLRVLRNAVAACPQTLHEWKPKNDVEFRSFVDGLGNDIKIKVLMTLNDETVDTFDRYKGGYKGFINDLLTGGNNTLKAWTIMMVLRNQPLAQRLRRDHADFYKSMVFQIPVLMRGFPDLEEYIGLAEEEGLLGTIRKGDLEREPEMLSNFTPAEFEQHRELVLGFMEKNGDYFRHAPDSWKKDLLTVLRVVGGSASAYRHASENLKRNPLVILTAQRAEENKRGTFQLSRDVPGRYTDTEDIIKAIKAGHVSGLAREIARVEKKDVEKERAGEMLREFLREGRVDEAVAVEIFRQYPALIVEPGFSRNFNPRYKTLSVLRGAFTEHPAILKHAPQLVHVSLDKGKTHGTLQGMIGGLAPVALNRPLLRYRVLRAANREFLEFIEDRMDDPDAATALFNEYDGGTKKVQLTRGILQIASNPGLALPEHRELALKLIRKNSNLMPYLPEELRRDAGFVKDAVRQKPIAIRHTSPALIGQKAYNSIAREAYEAEESTFEYIKSKIDRDTYRELVGAHPELVAKRKDVVAWRAPGQRIADLAEMIVNGPALEMYSRLEDLDDANKKSLILKVVEKYSGSNMTDEIPGFLQMVRGSDEELFADHDFVWSLFNENPESMRYASKTAIITLLKRETDGTIDLLGNMDSTMRTDLDVLEAALRNTQDRPGVRNHIRVLILPKMDEEGKKKVEGLFAKYIDPSAPSESVEYAERAEASVHEALDRLQVALYRAKMFLIPRLPTGTRGQRHTKKLWEEYVESCAKSYNDKSAARNYREISLQDIEEDISELKKKIEDYVGANAPNLHVCPVLGVGMPLSIESVPDKENPSPTRIGIDRILLEVLPVEIAERLQAVYGRDDFGEWIKKNGQVEMLNRIYIAELMGEFYKKNQTDRVRYIEGAKRISNAISDDVIENVENPDFRIKLLKLKHFVAENFEHL